MSTQTTSNFVTSGSLGEKIRREAIPVFESNLYFAKLGKMANLPMGFNKYTFPTVDESAAAVTLTEGVTPTEGQATITNVEVTLSQFGKHVVLSDVLLSDAPVSVVVVASVEMARVTAEKFDADIQDVLDAGTNVTYQGQTARADITTSDVITSTAFAKEVNLLRASDAPKFDGGYYISVMHPHVFHDLQQESGTGTFIDLRKYDTPEELFSGEAGAQWGARILLSSNVQFYADGGASSAVDVYPTYFIGKDAYGVVMSGGLQTIAKPLGSGGTEDPLNQRMTVGAKIRGKAAILKQAAIRRLETASSLGANT